MASVGFAPTKPLQWRIYSPLSLLLNYTAKNCECRTRTGKYEWTFSALPNLLHEACFMTGLEPAKY